MLATGLGLVLGSFFFLLPRVGLWPPGSRELLAVSVYTLTTMLCVVLCENLHHCIRRLEHALEGERHRHMQKTQADAFASAPNTASSASK
jgi:hypothetical protein